MGLRELKETAHAQYLRGRFEQCAQTYRQILKLAPKDPNVRVRLAEACRRAGDRQQAIASYRAAADLLLAVGCESRARGALKAALELDPKDPVLLADLARVGQSGPAASEDERPHGLPLVPGVLEPWEPSTPGPRSLTAAGAPSGRSMTSAGVPAPYSMTSAGVPAARPMTSAGVPAPRPMTSAGVPVPRAMSSTGGPAPRSMTSAEVPAPRSMTSAGVPAPRSTAGAQNAPVRRALPMAPAGSVYRPPPVAPLLPPRGASAFHEAAPSAPASAASATPAPSSSPTVRLQAEVRRLGPNAVAFRLTPQSRWVLFTSQAPIQVRRVDSLEEAQQETRDFSLDITVEEPEHLDVDALR